MKTIFEQVYEALEGILEIGKRDMTNTKYDPFFESASLALHNARVSMAINKHEPIPMLLYCPECSERHIDVGEFETKPHHTHACQSCGLAWRPAIVPTVGVRFLPGFKNAPGK